MVRGPSPLPNKGAEPRFSAHVYCSQKAAWIKMPLGTQIGLVLCDIVLGAQCPIFGQCPLWPNS